MRKLNQRMVRLKGFTIIVATWLMMSLSTALLVSAHFVGERIRAIKRLERIEGRIHLLHKRNFKGRRKFWPSFDRPTQDARKQGLTRRSKVKPHHIAIDFGR